MANSRLSTRQTSKNTTGTIVVGSVSQAGNRKTSLENLTTNTIGSVLSASGAVTRSTLCRRERRRRNTVASGAKTGHVSNGAVSGVVSHSPSHRHAKTGISGFARKIAGPNGNPERSLVRTPRVGVVGGLDTTGRIGNANDGPHSTETATPVRPAERTTNYTSTTSNPPGRSIRLKKQTSCGI